MKWIETMIVRSAKALPRGLCREWVRNLLREERVPRPETVKVYRNDPLETDLKITLQWDSERCPPGGSPPARHLLHVLKEHGLVSYRLWVEEDVENGMGR